MLARQARELQRFHHASSSRIEATAAVAVALSGVAQQANTAHATLRHLGAERRLQAAADAMTADIRLATAAGWKADADWGPMIAESLQSLNDLESVARGDAPTI